MRRGIILVTGSDRRRCWKTRISKGLLQVGLQGKVGLSSFRVGILTIAGFAETVVQHLVSLLKRGLVEAGFAKVALVRLDPSVNVLVLFQMRRPFEVAVAMRAFIRLLPRVTAFVARLVRPAAESFVAKFALVRLLFCMAAFVLSQIGILTESRWTILATERFFTGVSPLMLLQVRLSGKISLAILTLVLALFTVRSHVQLFLFQILKCRWTMRTLM